MILEESTEDGVSLVERLLDAGLDPDARWPVINVSVLEIAARNGYVRLVEKLVLAGARLKNPLERDRTIVDVIQAKHSDVAKMLIEDGIAADLKGVVTTNALVCAAIDGFDDVVLSLLKRGVKIDREVDTHFEGVGSAEGITALMAAVRHGHVSTVKILLSAGANPNAEDAIGRTVLDWLNDAKNRNAKQRIRRLIENSVGFDAGAD